jgi:uncharacterized protein (UPF0216 family)
MERTIEMLRIEMLNAYINAATDQKFFSRRELARLEAQLDELEWGQQRSPTLFDEIRDCRRVIADCDEEIAELVAERNALIEPR